MIVLSLINYCFSDGIQFLDVKDFISDGMSKDESIQAAAKQVQFLQSKSATKIASPDSVVDPEFSLALLKLGQFLPPKQYCDRLVSIYCNNFERTMRVLHIPTFMHQYEQLWASNISDTSNSPSIVPQLTVVMTMAYLMEDAGEFMEDQTHRSYLKRNANDLVQAWLDELTRKQRTELSTLQVEVLLLLSRSLRGMHPEQLWSSAGALVRYAMAMGLHINPTAITEYSPYQAELRRRLWATIFEIDLQASMATGMPVVLPSVDPSSLGPSNLNDLDFEQSTAILPTPHPLHIYTDNLYQVVLASSLTSRLEVLSAIQRSAPNLQQAVELGESVRACIDQIPQSVSLCDDGMATLDGGSLMHRVLLDLYLRRPVLCLYKPLLLGSYQATPAYSEIQRRCLEFAVSLLSYQDLYTVTALSAVTTSPMAHQNFFYRCCKMDILWAALTCCQRIRALPNEGVTTSADGECDTGKSSLVKRVQITIDCLVDRIGQKGSDVKDLVFIALALQASQLPDTSLTGKQWVEYRTGILKQTVRKTLSACRERLLQPIFANEHPQYLPPAKYLQTPTGTAITATTTTSTPRISNPGVTPIPTSNTLNESFPMRFSHDAGQWFGDLPDLAADFQNFQANIHNPDDIMNFGIAQDFHWEHMWQ